LTDKRHELVALSAPVVAGIEAAWRERLGEAGNEELHRLLADLREITDRPLPH
jgi:hypothetical protein